MQCLHTSDDISQRKSGLSSVAVDVRLAGAPTDGMPRSTAGLRSPDACWPSGLGCSMNATCRQVLALSEPVLS